MRFMNFLSVLRIASALQTVHLHVDVGTRRFPHGGFNPSLPPLGRCTHEILEHLYGDQAQNIRFCITNFRQQVQLYSYL